MHFGINYSPALARYQAAPLFPDKGIGYRHKYPVSVTKSSNISIIQAGFG